MSGDEAGKARAAALHAAFLAGLAAEARAGVRVAEARRDAPQVDPWTFITREQLARDTAALLAAIPADVDAVIAIARSGFLPGGDVATRRHIPLAGVSRAEGVVPVGHGLRLDGREAATPRHVLVIDDTAASGWAMAEHVPIVRAAFPDARITRAVVYCHPDARGAVDLYAATYPGVHYLEWNWANAGHAERCGFDFDGILVPNGAESPLYLPRRSPVKLIATGRPESARAVTEAWLSRWGVRCDRLEMRPESVPDDDESIARWKAGVYKASDCVLFAESEPTQAEIIAEASGRAVLCPALGRVIPAKPVEAPRLSVAEHRRRMVLVNACPDRGCKRGCQKTECRRHRRDVYLSECIACVGAGLDA